MSLAKGLALAMAGVLAAALAGCSFSYSSASISDSISGSSRSVSDSISSSSPDGSSASERAYREDVRDYTRVAARRGGGPEALREGLARVAERHGVLHWEADRATWIGIGEGLRRAGLDAAGVERWKQELAGDEPSGVPAGRLIEQGYDAGRS